MQAASSTNNTTPALNLDVPNALSTVQVRIIDTTSWRKAKVSTLFKPPIPGFDELFLPSWAFLISHASTHVLFDLGIRKDWQTGFPPVFDPFLGKVPGDPDSVFHINVEKDVRDILDNGHRLDLNSASISACIWSHHHFDHRGDITRFPSSTQLVIGPGLRETYLPGYPTDPDGELWESEFHGRHIRELEEKDFTLMINGFPAHDYFADGSFYLLSSPGHTNGHLSGLARVTSSNSASSFVFMGGDCTHHCGVFRPSQYLALPRHITLYEREVISTDVKIVLEGHRIVQKLHPRRLPDSPFLDVDDEPMCENSKEAIQSMKNMQAFDASEHVLVCIAHDATLREHLPFFPKTLNNWQVQGLKEKVRWQFLKDFDLTACAVE